LPVNFWWSHCSGKEWSHCAESPGKEVIVLAKTDPIPNDPITFSKSISSELALKIAVAMVKIAATDEGKKLLKEMYGVEGLARATDGDYNSLRAVISAK
jgi:phosphonate transport system substrate-binding protein